jgi:3-hydroxyisobutyrate dehydrogenase-like beta-hydroxyacid dehydrogenase
MYRINMIGPGEMGMPMARNLMERGFETIGHQRHGSPELAAARSAHDQVSRVSAFGPGEPS